jgi:hypothetical protein
MKLVIDTNIIVSGLIFLTAPPAQLIDLWNDDVFTLVTSQFQLQELRRVAEYEHLRDRVRPDRLASFWSSVDATAIIIGELPVVELSIDPDDNSILATAIAGDADLIVSGDKRHMLSLGKAHGIPIVTARTALDRLSPPIEQD